jgi:hypothetical protein
MTNKAVCAQKCEPHFRHSARSLAALAAAQDDDKFLFKAGLAFFAV